MAVFIRFCKGCFRCQNGAIKFNSFLIDYHDGNMYYDGRRKLLEKHTHKNALFACESESAMGGGERGGL